MPVTAHVDAPPVRARTKGRSGKGAMLPRENGRGLRRARTLDIRGFQRHKRLKLRLSRTITTIVGPTDAGKSAVLRAIRWLALNDPAGAAFVRDGSSRARVKLKLGDKWVGRTRGVRANEYTLGSRRFKAFGGEPPQDVADVLRLDDINFQSQYERPFWLADSAGEVSRQLNRIVDLDIIDKTLANLGHMERRTKAAVEICKQRAGEARAERKKWAYAKPMDASLRRVEKLYAQLKAVAERRDQLGVLVKSLGEQEEKARQLGGSLPDVGELERLWGVVSKARGRRRLLATLLSELRSLRERERVAREGAQQDERQLASQLRGKCPLCGK